MDSVAWGIEPEYRDVRGRRWQTSKETQAAILEAMDARGPHPAHSPVRFVRAGESAWVGRAELVTEDGGGELMDGVLPPDLPTGYHRLVDPDSGESVRLFVTPGACYLPAERRMWGWAVQAYALRSSRAWGIGDLSDLSQFNRWAAGCGAGLVVINPLHSSEPYPLEDSPYYPGSRLWRNPLYLRIEDVPGGREEDRVRSLGAEGRALNNERLIERPDVYELKMGALEVLWERFEQSRSFDDYCEHAGRELESYATFVVLNEHFGPSWHDWPTEFKKSTSSAVHGFAAANRERVRFHMWIQWLLDTQLREAASHVRVVNDLAVGVNPLGADTWIFSDCFAHGVGIGAPPDDFNLAGQNWGVAAFDPWKLQAHEYDPFIQMIRSSFRHAGGLRYDHVMGLFRLFWIPEGADPADGAYVRYPHSDLLDILAIESHRAAALVIGEDLGTVEKGVRTELRSRSVLSNRLMIFESDDPANYPECALAGVTNHDLPTLPGLLSGADVVEQKELGVVANEEFAATAAERARRLAGEGRDAPISSVVAGCYRRLAESPSRVVAATLEDALGVNERANLPGTTASQRPNWRLSLPLTLEEIESHNGAGELTAAIRAARRSRSVT